MTFQGKFFKGLEGFEKEMEMEMEMEKIVHLKKVMDIGFLLGQGETAEEILKI